MTCMFYCFVLITGLYACMIIAYALGWYKQHSCSQSKTEPSIKVTVVVALRNESQHLPFLLKGLQQQTYPHFEVLLINDHSTDNSKTVFDSFLDSRFRWIDAVENGKKAAIAQAVSLASGDVILTTDADVTLPATWIEKMVLAYQDRQVDLLIGPVSMIQATAFELLDYWSLEGTTIGSASIQNPVLCSGANLAFSPSWYQKCRPYLHFDVPSGDDMFLLEATRRLKGKIYAIKDKQATVLIQGCSSLSSFLMQRARWAGKAPRYKDAALITAALLVTCMQIIGVASMIIAFWQPVFVGFILAKSVVDLLLVGQVALYHQTYKPMLFYPFVSLLYPLYVIIVLILTLFPLQWKQRKL